MNMTSGGRFPTPNAQVSQSPHHRPQTIKDALRDCVRIPVKEFALIAICENGELQTYASPPLSKYHDKIFSESFKSTFTRAAHRVNRDGNFAPNGFGLEGILYNQFDIDNDIRQGTTSSESPRHRKTRSDDSDEEGSGSSKRTKRGHNRRGRDHSSDDTPVATSRRTRELEIGNSKDVKDFYTTRFKDMQQTACKTIGKAFVKLVEPKKQTHHPYTKGDALAPPWWPSDKHLGEEYVRHKEPDHLYKKERIALLVHILRMIVQPPAKQHPSVQKVALTVQKLEEVTNEAMSTWFADAEHPENKQKKVYLKEIFKVAKLEQRYLNGEVDHTTTVPIMFGERNIVNAADESEDEGQPDTPQGNQDEDADHKNMTAGLPTPDSMPLVSPALSQHQHMHANEPDSMRMHLTHRYNTHSMESQNNFAEPANYFPRQMEAFQQSPTMQDPMRRSFTAQDYHASPHSGLGWQQQTMSGASAASSSYYAQATLPPAPGSVYQLPQTLPPPHTMIPPNLGSHFDGLPSGRYDPNIGPVSGAPFRTGSLGHPHQMSPHGFQDYLQPNDGPYAHNSPEMKEEDHQHHSMQHQGQ